MLLFRVKFFFSLLLVFFVFDSLFARDTTKIDYESTIKVSAKLSAKEVPLNRTVTLYIVVEWTGDLKRYQISELENPIVDNFDIIETATSDRRSNERGVEKAARIYEFVLEPKSFGMGYVESVAVKYIDSESGEAFSLMTNRLNVKVVDPIPEPGSRWGLIRWIVIILILAIVLISLYIWYRKKKIREQAAAESVKVVPLEEEFLTTLHESLNLNSSELNINEGFWVLSRIIRKYLSQKYEIPAMESTTEKIMAELEELDLDQTIVHNIQEILSVSDLAKFAGSESNRNELDRIYTLIEAILERNLADNRQKDQTNQDAK